MNCPSGFALDELLTHGPGAPGVGAHVTACVTCQDQLAARREEAARFAPLAAAVWEGVVARTSRPPRRGWWRPMFLAPLGLAGAFAVLLALRASTDDSPYTGAKGGFTLTVAARRGGELFTVDRAHPVRPGDELRFIPAGVADGRYIAIVSVDGAGKASFFYPSSAGGSSVPMPPAGQPLPGGIVLDDAPGPERLFIAITNRPIAASAVRDAARAEATEGASAEQALGAAGARVFRVALEKSTAAGPP